MVLTDLVEGETGRQEAISVGVVIPSFRASKTIGHVIRGIGSLVTKIYVVDDGCPDASGEQALRECEDPRLIIVRNRRNLGVGGAMKRGYRHALADGMDIIVKLDADGQMDPANIPYLIAPIAAGNADYTKGNRFAPASQMPPGSCPHALTTMPLSRQIANRALSLIHSAATGYRDVSDPANGYTAIHAKALGRVGLEHLADCFFFETDMLFRLRLAGAVVVDVPLPARYPAGVNSVSLLRVAPRFARLIATRWVQRMLARVEADDLGTYPLEPLWCRTPPY